MKSCNKIILCFLIIISFLLINDGLLTQAQETGELISYEEYLAKYQWAEKPDRELILSIDNLTDKSSNVEIISSFEGVDGPVIKTEEEGYVEWEFYLAEAGLYNIEIKYYPVSGRRTGIEREIYINGVCPFRGAENLIFTRVWQDGDEVLTDINDNEIRPPQVENPVWRTSFLGDSNGYYPDPYKFYFREGKNTIRLVSIVEPMIISYIKITQEEEIPGYEELKDYYEMKAYKKAENVFIKIQGEDAKYKSDPTLYPIFDQGDPSAEPYHPAKIRLNAIGGYHWSNINQWLLWEFEVPEDGLYKIAIKGKQNQKPGFYSNRRLFIDGKTPFQEVKAIRFPFSSNYIMNELQDEDGEVYLFYLEKGKHTLQLNVVLGGLVDIVKKAEESLYDLTTIYRQIIMITSTRPDHYRDYQLEERIPNLINELKSQADKFEEIKCQMEEYIGLSGGHISYLQEISILLNRMYKEPERIPRLLDQFKDHLASLGTWLSETTKQPLTIDYIIIASPEKKMPAATVSFFGRIKHEIMAFLATFTNDYSQIGDIRGDDFIEPEVRKEEETIKVWIGLGRDQGQVLKQMIEDTFTPETGIPVELELIENMSNLLVPAILAGTAPDVAIGAANMELAFRGALVDLSEFADFGEVSKRFMKSAFLPYTFRDKVYALPESQGFPMMFYRKDILAELGLEVPETWDDVYEIIPILQRNNMNIGLGDLLGTGLTRPGLNTLLLFLYQQRIPLYKEDGIATNLDSEAVVQAINQVTDLYSLYNLPQEFDVQNRFRFGETPIVITTYGLYNSLKVFAPELRGQWGMAPVPGTVEEDGTINRAVPVGSAQLVITGAQAAVPPGTTGAVILNKSDKKGAAWEFLKWWTREDTQARFGLELESLMGSAARYATANIAAMKQLPWSREEREMLLEQWKWVEGVPPVLGGYYVQRQFDWLFRAVVLDNQPVRESIQKYNRAANTEIARKRSEFGLETDYEKLEEEWKELYWQNYTIVNKLDLEKYKEIKAMLEEPENIFNPGKGE